MYLKRAGELKTLADLSSHSIIVGPVSTNPTWSFQKNGMTSSIRIEGRARIAGNEGSIAAAVAGLEIVMSSSGPLRREFHEGKLKRVFEDWDLGTIELSAVFAAGRTTKRAARTFAEFLIEVLKDIR